MWYGIVYDEARTQCVVGSMNRGSFGNNKESKSHVPVTLVKVKVAAAVTPPCHNIHESKSSLFHDS